MKILIDIGHPAHVHFFKHAIWNLQQQGHSVFLSAREKDVTLSLLEHYKFEFRILSSIGRGRFGLIREFLQREFALMRLLKEYNPDVVTGIGGDFIAPVAKILGVPSIIFTDSEPVPVDNILAYPFATALCTPTCFEKDLGKRHIRYNGYHELAYLSPDCFSPDPGVLFKVGLDENEPFSVLRFVAWKASHDIGQSGISFEKKQELVQTLKRYGRVFITSEDKLHEDFEQYRINLPAYQIHDLMHYAQLFMGDGATMATEAAILGTPAVRSSSMALNMGNFVELMNRYKLVFSYYDFDEALEQAVKILEKPDSKEEWKLRRNKMLAEKIDVTQFILNTLENYAHI
jgi:predicted glycosyltransferase